MTMILDEGGEKAATICGWSDRNPATIVQREPRRIIVQRDRVEQMSSPTTIERNEAYARGHGDVVIFIRDYDAPIEVFTLRKNGRFIRRGHDMANGSRLSLGRRCYYRDPSF